MTEECSPAKKQKGQMALIAVRAFEPYEEMYKIVDFLNKSLKNRRLMFGLAKSSDGGSMTISIYEI